MTQKELFPRTVREQRPLAVEAPKGPLVKVEAAQLWQNFVERDDELVRTVRRVGRGPVWQRLEARGLITAERLRAIGPGGRYFWHYTLTEDGVVELVRMRLLGKRYGPRDVQANP